MNNCRTAKTRNVQTCPTRHACRRDSGTIPSYVLSGHAVVRFTVSSTAGGAGALGTETVDTKPNRGDRVFLVVRRDAAGSSYLLTRRRNNEKQRLPGNEYAREVVD